jgi:hypothetical protein
MNILGEGFPKEIIDQVKLRQQKYGSGYVNGAPLRTPEEIVFLNSKTAWCKLISSTDITDSSILNNSNISSLGYNSDTLAKNFILFNGTVSQERPTGKSGVGTDFVNNAYTSWGIPNADFGFRPMAGITSVVVKHKNRGSIRTAAINIKAWDKISFEIVDTLYLRLGFSILLEWGNSLYFDNKGELITKEDNSLANDFLDGKVTYSDFLFKIKEQRKKTHGNYDAMFGKVTNFHWSFNQDGSYDIILDLVSIGDVIESFKISGNALTTNSTNNKDNKVNLSDPENKTGTITYEVLKAYASTSDIANYLYRMSILLNQQGQVPYLINYSYKSNDSDYWGQFGEFNKAKQSGFTTTDAVKVISPPTDSNSSYAEVYFIRLGNLLKFIEEAIMYKVKNTGGEKPFLLFSVASSNNFMHVPPQLMSYDPNICMVRRSIDFLSPTGNQSSDPILNNTGGPSSNIDPITGLPIPNNYVEKPSVTSIPTREYFYITINGITSNEAINPFMVDDLPEVGKIMDIYVNFRYILTKLQELTDKDTNELKLFSFLKEILTGINSAFCGYSKLDLFIDETTNQVKIIDQNPLPSTSAALKHINKIYTNSNIPTIPTEYAYFELYGYNNKDKTAGFIKDFKFNTELTPEFATMIAVSATSNGNVIGENNTALSKLNLGLKDRFKEEVNGGGALLNGNNGLTIAEKLINNFNTAQNEYIDFISNLKNYLDNLYVSKYINDEIQDNKGAFTIYLKLYKKYKKTESDLNNYLSLNDKSKISTKFQPGTGFIPFNLSLTMDGLSGMKIGSKFLIDGSYLPSNYPSTVDFLIKNITHEIKDNYWSTNIESYCIAQGDDEINTRSSSKPNPNPNPNPTPNSNPTLIRVNNLDPWIKDEDIFRYLTWNQGAGGLAQHYSIATGKRKTYSTGVPAKNIKQNWPGGYISETNNIKASDVDRLYNVGDTDDEKFKNNQILACAFLNVWKQFFEKKINTQSFSIINGNEKDRMGNSFSNLKILFNKYATPELTANNLTKFAFIENGFNSDTIATSTYQTMFQINKSYPNFKTIINKANKGINSGHTFGWINYDQEIVIKETIPLIISTFNDFKKRTGFPK